MTEYENNDWSFDEILRRIETVPPESFEKTGKVNSKMERDDKDNLVREVFYEHKGFSFQVGDLRVSVEQRNSESFPDGKICIGGVQPTQRFLGYHIKVLKGGRFVGLFEEDEKVKGLYEQISSKVEGYEERKRGENLACFKSLLEKLVEKAPSEWNREEDHLEEIPKNLRATAFLYASESYSTRVGELEVVLDEITGQIGDVFDGIAFPHPYSDPEIRHRMRVLEEEKIKNSFEGEENEIYKSFITSSIQILRDYHKKRQK